jgi:nitrate reductase alpha subunit
MAHVILREFHVEREVPYFAGYARRFTDLPFLVTLRERGGAYVPGAFLTAADLGDDGENAVAKTVLWDAAAGAPAVPNGSIGFRWGDEGAGRWNLDLGDVEPALTLLDSGESVAVDLPRFDVGETEGGGTMRRGVPVRRVAGRLVTTVFDLFVAQLGVGRDGLPGAWPAGLDDPPPGARVVDVDGWANACADLPLAHMGRGPADDPWFFASAFAAGRLAGSLR